MKALMTQAMSPHAAGAPNSALAVNSAAARTMGDRKMQPRSSLTFRHYIPELGVL